MKLIAITPKVCPSRWTKLSFVAFLIVATVVLTRYLRVKSVFIEDDTGEIVNDPTIKHQNNIVSKKSSQALQQQHLSENVVHSNHMITTTTTPKSNIKSETITPTWNPESSERLNRIETECKKQELTALRRVWTMASNKDHTGRPVPCNDKMCPMIADESNLFLSCSIPRVASASIKEVFLKSQNLSTSMDYLEESERVAPPDLETARRVMFQKEANDVLRRVSAMYFPEYVMRRYYKFLFVRHPFERLLSTYLTINNLPLEERQYFYAKYWSGNKTKLPNTPNQIETDLLSRRITFKQFVHYLLNTHPVYYDAFWQPYWTRCSLCQLHYDFVGKLETANQDLAFVLQAMELDQSLAEQLSVFLRNNGKRKSTNLPETIKYYKDNLDESEILKLYETYYIDFKLFDYEIRDFVSEKNLTVIDNNVKLDSILF